MKSGRDLIALTLAFGALFFFLLGRAPLANPDEGRYAEIPREMVASGDWVTPRLDGVNYFEKPPLIYWTVASNLELFGPSEWSVRAVPALFGLGGVLLTYLAARRLHGRAGGIGAAVVLGTSLLYFGHTHFLIIDLVVAILMSATLFFFMLGIRAAPGRHRRWLFYGLYASAALATLTKGLIGFLVTGAVMFLWLLLFKQWKRLRPLYLPTGVALFLLLTAPWHIMVALRNPTWVHRYFVEEHFERYFTPSAGRQQPWYFFLPIIVLGLFPWTGFLWAALRDRLAGGWARRGQNADSWFLVTWVVFIFLFFSASHSKLEGYILPVFPALAMLVGAWLAKVMRAGESLRLRSGLIFFVILCGLLGAGALVAVLVPGLLHQPGQAQLLRSDAFALATVLLSGGAGTAWLWWKRGEAPALSGLVMTAVLFFTTLTPAMPQIERPGTKELALIVKATAQPGDRVLHYHEYFDDFMYYAARTVEVVEFKGELELEEDAAARASGRFMKEAAFRQLWMQPTRVFAVARKEDVEVRQGCEHAALPRSDLP